MLWTSCDGFTVQWVKLMLSKFLNLGFLLFDCFVYRQKHHLSEYRLASLLIVFGVALHVLSAQPTITVNNRSRRSHSVDNSWQHRWWIMVQICFFSIVFFFMLILLLFLCVFLHVRLLHVLNKESERVIWSDQHCSCNRFPPNISNKKYVLSNSESDKSNFSFLITRCSSRSKSAAVYKISWKSDDFSLRYGLAPSEWIRK